MRGAGQPAGARRSDGNSSYEETVIARRIKTPPQAARLRALVEASLEDDKAEDIVVIDLAGKTDIADYMVIANGRSNRHVGAMAEHLKVKLKAAGLLSVPTEGVPQCDWVLIDSGDVIVHLFRPEVRTFYNLEKMWGAALLEMGPETGASAELMA